MFVRSKGRGFSLEKMMRIFVVVCSCFLFVCFQFMGTGFFSDPVVFAQKQAESPSKKETVSRFEKEIAAYVDASRENPPPEHCTMFVGSSTWRLWGKQLEVDFRSLHAVNRGFGGSKIPEVLDAADRLILPYKPARILFFCGSNDLASKADPETVFADFRKFLAKIWKNDPNCEIYFVSVPHAPSRKPYWANGDRLNAKIRALADALDGLYYIDVIDAMNDENGITREEFYLKDRLHMNRKGQECWIPLILDAVNRGIEKNNVFADPENAARERVKHKVFGR